MKHYRGKKFLRMIERKGASEGLQVILDSLQHPDAEDITAEAIVRRHFVNTLSPADGTKLFTQIELAYWKESGQVHSSLENVYIYDDEEEYTFYRFMAAKEAKNIHSN